MNCCLSTYHYEPDTNKSEGLSLSDYYETETILLRPSGEPVPQHWSVLQEGEHVVVKDYTFRVAYIYSDVGTGFPRRRG